MPKGAKVYPLRVTIKEITKGECPQEFKVGQSWDINPQQTPNGMCAGAYLSMAGTLRALGYGAEFPNAENNDFYYVSCPDPKRQVVYEIRRIRE